MDARPPNRPGGSNVLMLLILLLILGVALFWAWRESPPSAPDPTAISAPATPAGTPPAR